MEGKISYAADTDYLIITSTWSTINLGPLET